MQVLFAISTISSVIINYLLFKFEYALVKLVILAFFLDQMRVAAALYDHSVLKYHDDVRVLHCGKPVRDYKYGAALHEFVHAALHNRLGTRISGGCGFVEYHYRRVGRSLIVKAQTNNCESKG